MHIVEGYLPMWHCIIWFVLSLIVVIYGVFKLRGFKDANPEAKSLLYISGAVMFVLSCFKFPSVTGSGSHPTGNGFSGSLFGPAITSVLVAIMLVLQCFLFGHGGITTLGANIFSMGVVGPFVAWVIYDKLSKINFPTAAILFLAGFFADIFTYVTTSFQMALAFPQPTFAASFTNFIIIFFVSQLLWAIIDGIVVILLWYLIKPLSKLS